MNYVKNYSCKFCKQNLFNENDIINGHLIRETNFIFANIKKSNVYTDSYKRVHCKCCGHIIGDFNNNILMDNTAARFQKSLVTENIEISI